MRNKFHSIATAIVFGVATCLLLGLYVFSRVNIDRALVFYIYRVELQVILCDNEVYEHRTPGTVISPTLSYDEVSK